MLCGYPFFIRQSTVTFAKNSKPSKDTTFERRPTVPDGVMETEASSTLKLHGIGRGCRVLVVCRPSPHNPVRNTLAQPHVW
jgi:hypothetical protein